MNQKVVEWESVKSTESRLLRCNSVCSRPWDHWAKEKGGMRTNLHSSKGHSQGGEVVGAGT